MIRNVTIEATDFIVRRMSDSMTQPANSFCNITRLVETLARNVIGLGLYSVPHCQDPGFRNRMLGEARLLLRWF
jgi:hypothetical protein